MHTFAVGGVGLARECIRQQMRANERTSRDGTYRSFSELRKLRNVRAYTAAMRAHLVRLSRPGMPDIESVAALLTRPRLDSSAASEDDIMAFSGAAYHVFSRSYSRAACGHLEYADGHLHCDTSGVRHAKCVRCMLKEFVPIEMPGQKRQWIRRQAGGATAVMVSSDGECVTVRDLDPLAISHFPRAPDRVTWMLNTLRCNEYHSTQRSGYCDLVGLRDPNYKGPTFGVELELLPSRALSRDVALTWVKMNAKEKINIERDGSINEGFEVVTGFGAYEDVVDAMRRVYAPRIAWRRSRRAGMHVHIGEYGRIPDLMYAALLAAFLARNTEVHAVVAGRPNTRYCHKMPPQFSLPWGELVRRAGLGSLTSNLTRYYEVNLSRLERGAATYEWRRPIAQPRFIGALAQFQFIHALVDFFRVRSTDVLLSEPTMSQFVSHVMDMDRTCTAALRRLLTARPVQSRLVPVVPDLAKLAYNARREFQFCN
jgi:hypothetical protein